MLSSLTGAEGLAEDRLDEIDDSSDVRGELVAVLLELHRASMAGSRAAEEQQERLQAELASTKLSALKKRAREEGVAQDSCPRPPGAVKRP